MLPFAALYDPHATLHADRRQKRLRARQRRRFELERATTAAACFALRSRRRGQGRAADFGDAAVARPGARQTHGEAERKRMHRIVWRETDRRAISPGAQIPLTSNAPAQACPARARRTASARTSSPTPRALPRSDAANRARSPSPTSRVPSSTAPRKLTLGTSHALIARFIRRVYSYSTAVKSLRV